jgi:membrane dipeptidase
VIVDAHLDVAWNALYNQRDVTGPVESIRSAEANPGTVAMTSLDGFAAGGVGLVFATLYAEPAQLWAPAPPPMPRQPSKYETPEQAEAIALEMLELYERWADEGRIRIILDREGLDDHVRRFPQDRVPGFLILMEGADPIVAPDDLPRWFDRGLRMLGLCWGSTRYAGGTASSTALTDLGRELVHGMADLGIIHDASHLSEESFWEAAGLPARGFCVTHAAARALMIPPRGRAGMIPLNRFLSDQQIAEVARPHGAGSRGVIGLALLNPFLDPRWSYDTAGRANEVSMRAQGAAHLHHYAAVAGWESVGLGTDVDAGFGRDETPLELDSVDDWSRIADHVPSEARAGVLGENWLRFLRETLPAR